MEIKKTIVDVDAAEKISKVLLNLINTYPGLGDTDATFSSLLESSGIGFFPSSGAALLENYKGITGDHYQTCAYSFDIIYRSAPRTEDQRIKIKEFLDGMGRWLEKQPVSIGGQSYQINGYPTITSGHRFIREISRTSAAHLQTAYADGIEDWAISFTMKYVNSY